MNSSDASQQNENAGALFRTTHWSVVQDAGVDSDQGREALESLCRTYWRPLYAYVRRQRRQAAEAEDLTQEFFAHLLRTNRISVAQPERGRFRSFLLTSLKNFLTNEWDRANRLKRGGGRQILSLDAAEPEGGPQMEPAANAPDDLIFDRQWARALTGRVLARLRAEFERGGSPERFDVIKTYLAAEPTDASYQDASERLGISAAAMKSAIHRLRRRYGQMLREEIANTVSSEKDVDDEIRHLFSVLSS